MRATRGPILRPKSAEIAGSIREFGFTNPVLIDPDGGIGDVLLRIRLDQARFTQPQHAKQPSPASSTHSGGYHRPVATGVSGAIWLGIDKRCKWAGRSAAEEADHRHRLLLCAEGARRSHHAARLTRSELHCARGERRNEQLAAGDA